MDGNNKLVFSLRHPFTFSFIGPSMSGKTTTLLDLLERRREIMDVEFDRIIYIYTEDQFLFKQFKARNPDVMFTKDMNVLNDIDGCKSTLIFLEDKMLDIIGKDNEEVVSLFIKGAHHKNCSVILLLQNAFAKNLRTISINTIYTALFSNPRDKSSVSFLGRQIFPGRSNYFSDSYEKAVSKPYTYLFCDFHQQTNNLFRIRSSIFPTKECEVYVPKLD